MIQNRHKVSKTYLILIIIQYLLINLLLHEKSGYFIHIININKCTFNVIFKKVHTFQKYYKFNSTNNF